MTIATRWRSAALLALLGLLLLPSTSRAQAVSCATLITDAEVTKAVGAIMRNMGPTDRGGGTTECSWMLVPQGAFKTVFVGFEDLNAVKAAGGTADTLFETYVAGAEETGRWCRPGRRERA